MKKNNNSTQALDQIYRLIYSNTNKNFIYTNTHISNNNNNSGNKIIIMQTMITKIRLKEISDKKLNKLTPQNIIIIVITGTVSMKSTIFSLTAVWKKIITNPMEIMPSIRA